MLVASPVARGQASKPAAPSDPVKERAVHLLDFYKTIGADTKLKAAFAAEGNEVVDGLVKGNDFETALKLAPCVRSSLADANWDAAWNRKITRLRVVQEEYAKVKNVDSNDAGGAYKVGRFYCFVKEDWETGLPLLARGAETVAKLQAQSELAKPETKQLLEVADHWWDMSAKQEGICRENVKAHAISIYRTVLPNLQGVDKVRVEERIGISSDKPEIVSKEKVVGTWDITGKTWNGSLTLNTDGTAMEGNGRKGKWVLKGTEVTVTRLDGNWHKFDVITGKIESYNGIAATVKKRT
jgi:hypothetical protein